MNINVSIPRLTEHHVSDSVALIQLQIALHATEVSDLANRYALFEKFTHEPKLLHYPHYCWADRNGAAYRTDLFASFEDLIGDTCSFEQDSHHDPTEACACDEDVEGIIGVRNGVGHIRR